MPFDVTALRAQFPSLASGIAHFDGPGGTQTPAVVGEAIARTLTGPLSNRGVGAASEQNAEDTIPAFRIALADLLGASPAGLVYGRSATQIAYDFSRHLAKTWAPGDEVVVTQLDHDANVRPWIQAAAAKGVTVRWLRLDPDHRGTSSRRTRRRGGRAHPTGRRHRSLQPLGHQAARRRRSLGGHIRSERSSTWTECTTPLTRQSTSQPWAPTSSPAPPTSSSDRTAPPWPPIRRCSKP